MSQQPIYLTRAQVREIDRLSMEQYHIPGIVLMENAALAVVNAILEMSPRSVSIYCGGGNNGGDGLAAARHLHNRGIDLKIISACSELKGDALIQWQIVAAMHLKTTPLEAATHERADLIVDALLGTGITSAPRGRILSAIEIINKEAKCPILSIDVPSGLDCNTGEPLGECIRATRTVTFVAEKIGFKNPAARQYLGEVTVGDIGCPRELIAQVAQLDDRT